MTLEELRNSGTIIFECVSGSHSHGLASETSDLDIKGVFVLPKEQYYGLEYIPQISDERNDNVYYELGRFVELLVKNNPTALELLSSPSDCVRIRHEVMDSLSPEMFLSKLCKSTFTGYATSQIGKAKGLNKKINNPMPKQRKSLLEFCYVNERHHTRPLLVYLDELGLGQEDCGLSSMTNMPDLYALFHGQKLGYVGIMNSITSNDVSLSSIPKGESPIAYLYFSKSNYSNYCREHRQYWTWVKERNEERFKGTKKHGKNYDAKNMMHTIRLLRMALEIGLFSQVRIRRDDKEELLRIKAGEFEYQDLIEICDRLVAEIELAFDESSLPESTTALDVNSLLFRMRSKVYGQELL